MSLPTCPACGIPYHEHLGLTGTCAALREIAVALEPMQITAVNARELSVLEQVRVTVGSYGLLERRGEALAAAVESVISREDRRSMLLRGEELREALERWRELFGPVGAGGEE